MFGQPPTGKRVSIGEFEIVRFQDGKIVDLRNTFDADALAVQLAN